MLRYKDIVPYLENVSFDMERNGLRVDLVAHLGDKTKKLGDYFADFFNTPNVELPSLLRPRRNRILAGFLNYAYHFFPESVLRLLSKQYKRIYQGDDRVLKKDFELEKVIDGHKSILLVDDNAFTGKTFENWKKLMEREIDIHTFSITINGSYKPDYFCLAGWHSFEWRRIGI